MEKGPQMVGSLEPGASWSHHLDLSPNPQQGLSGLEECQRSQSYGWTSWGKDTSRLLAARAIVGRDTNTSARGG